mgnify:FL=1
MKNQKSSFTSSKTEKKIINEQNFGSELSVDPFDQTFIDQSMGTPTPSPMSGNWEMYGFPEEPNANWNFAGMLYQCLNGTVTSIQMQSDNNAGGVGDTIQTAIGSPIYGSGAGGDVCPQDVILYCQANPTETSLGGIINCAEHMSKPCGTLWTSAGAPASDGSQGTIYTTNSYYGPGTNSFCNAATSTSTTCQGAEDNCPTCDHHLIII